MRFIWIFNEPPFEACERVLTVCIRLIYSVKLAQRTYAFLPGGHLDFESAVTAQTDKFKWCSHGSFSRLTSRLSQEIQYLASTFTDTLAYCTYRNISCAQEKRSFLISTFMSIPGRGAERWSKKVTSNTSSRSDGQTRAKLDVTSAGQRRWPDKIRVEVTTLPMTKLEAIFTSSIFLAHKWKMLGDNLWHYEVLVTKRTPRLVGSGKRGDSTTICKLALTVNF